MKTFIANLQSSHSLPNQISSQCRLYLISFGFTEPFLVTLKIEGGGGGGGGGGLRIQSRKLHCCI